MKKILIVLFFSLLNAQENNALASKNIYQEELALLKQEKQRSIFDKKKHDSISRFEADIELSKNVTLWQRQSLFMFLSFDVVIVTKETMPQLYAYIEQVCAQENMAVPTIFLTRKKGFLNAFASKLLGSAGGIVIGQEIINESTQEGLEAIITHELGHIKHNHVVKSIALFFMSRAIFDAAMKKYPLTSNDRLNQGISLVAALTLPKLIINKRFEQQADAFAFKHGKAHGIKGFFEHLIQKSKQFDADYDNINELLEQNKNQLSKLDFVTFKTRFYCTKYYTKAYKWLYYNTPYGAHPSHEKRIAAAEEYLNTSTYAA